MPNVGFLSTSSCYAASGSQNRPANCMILVVPVACKGYSKRKSPMNKRKKDKPVKASFETATLVLRCLSDKCTFAALREMLDSKGFTGKYNFLYLPLSMR